MKAGTLEIELITNVARLETELNRVKRAAADLGLDVGRVARRTGDHMDAMASSFQRAGRAITVSAGQQRAGMQQLSYQIGDVAQQFAMGTNPMIIFAQQGGQVVQSLSLMRGGAGGLIGFLGGPWGAVIMGAATMAGMFASRLWESRDAANDAAASYKSAADEAKGLIGAQNALALNGKMMERNRLWDERAQLENLVASRPGARDPGTGWRFWEDNYRRGGAKNRINEINQELLQHESLIKLAERENAKLASTMDRVGKSAGGAARGIGTAGRAAGSAAAVVRDLEAEYQRSLRGKLADLGEDGGSIFGRNIAYFMGPPIVEAWGGLGDALAIEAERSGIRAGKGLRNAVVQSFDLAELLELGGVSNRQVFQSIDLLGRSNPGAMRDIGQTFTKSLDKFFGGEGEFTKAMQAGGAGMAIGGMVLGSKGSDLGSFAGGILGKEFGKSVLGPMMGKLGSFGGPIGTILGSVLGGVIGGALKKTKKASATIGFGADGLEVSSLTGNSGSRKAASSQAAGGVIDALMAIADQLGGDLGGPVAVSIGMRKKSYRVDPTGGGNTKTSKGAIDFGQDAEAAIKYAIADAIADGAITGLSATIQRLIQKGDIERQMEKALRFQGALDDFKERTDPLGFAIDKLAREMEGLAKIAQEAGASEAELAQLRELGLLKQKDAIAQAQQDLLAQVSDKRNLEIRILELLGKKTAALAAAREMELLGMEESLRPLQKLINQLEDAQAVIDQFGPLADDLRAYRAELLGDGAAAQSTGYLLGQFNALAASAANGDPMAMAGLRGAGGAYLSAVRLSAGSAFEYNLARGRVLAGVEGGLFAAETKVDYAQLQIEAIERQTNILASIGETLASQQAAIATNSAKMALIWDRVTNGGDAVLVRTDADTPLNVEALGWAP